MFGTKVYLRPTEQRDIAYVIHAKHRFGLRFLLVSAMETSSLWGYAKNEDNLMFFLLVLIFAFLSDTIFLEYLNSL